MNKAILPPALCKHSLLPRLCSGTPNGPSCLLGFKLLKACIPRSAFPREPHLGRIFLLRGFLKSQSWDQLSLRVLTLTVSYLGGSKSRAFICPSGFGAEVGGGQLTSGCTEAPTRGTGGVARRWPTWTWRAFPVPGGGRAITGPEDARWCGVSHGRGLGRVRRGPSSGQRPGNLRWGGSGARLLSS